MKSWAAKVVTREQETWAVPELEGRLALQEDDGGGSKDQP